MSQGIMPSGSRGGVVTRDLAGVAQSPANVYRAYTPPATFGANCTFTALPSDCTAKWDPEQINAIVSELMCLAAALHPTGAWNCASVCNLASMLMAFLTGTGDGTLSGYVTSEPIIAGISSAVISATPHNLLVLGGDGGITLPPGHFMANSVAP